MSRTSLGLFITGTGTGVGKTYVAALIARSLAAAGWRVGVYKPAASGCSPDAEGRLVSGDALALWEAAGRPGDLDDVCPQVFAAPLAPHLAAKAEGRRLDPALLRTGLDRWRSMSDIVLVEGAGGLMSPLGETEYVADLAREFGFPLVVVSENVLGTINATLQTLMAASVYRGGLTVAGVVLNHPSPPPAGDVSLASNRSELAVRCERLSAESPSPSGRGLGRGEPVLGMTGSWSASDTKTLPDPLPEGEGDQSLSFRTVAVSPLLASVEFGAHDFDRTVDWYGLARRQVLSSKP